MPIPVNVLPTTAAAGGGLPIDPLQRLAETQRVMSYQNAFVRAGWRNWDLSLKEAEYRLRQQGSAYKDKVEYLKSLQTALTAANKDLTDIENARASAITGFEEEAFKAKTAAERQRAEQETEARKISVQERGDTYRAMLGQEAEAARQEQRLSVEAQKAQAAAAEKEADKTSKNYPRDNPLKNFKENERLVGERKSAFFYNGARADAATPSYFDELNKQISNFPLAASGDDERAVSNFTLLDQMASAKAAKDKISHEDAAKLIAKTLPASTLDLIRKGRDLVIPKPSGGTITADGGVGPGGGGISVPPLRESEIAKVGTSYRPVAPKEISAPSADVGKEQYEAAQAAAKKRIADLEAAIGALGLGQQAQPGLIRTAQQIYKKEFASPRMPAKPQIDILVNTPDPWSGHKSDATSRARELLGLYSTSLDNPDSAKTWADWESGKVASAVRDLISKTKIEDLQHAKEVLATRYPTAVTKQEDIDRAKDAMTAFIIYSQLKKQGRKVQSGTLESQTPYEY